MESMKSDILAYTSNIIKETVEKSLPHLVQTYTNQQQMLNAVQPDSRQVSIQTQRESPPNLPQNQQMEGHTQPTPPQQSFQYSQMIPVQAFHPQLMTHYPAGQKS